jgi:hypothetical protein
MSNLIQAIRALVTSTSTRSSGRHSSSWHSLRVALAQTSVKGSRNQLAAYMERKRNGPSETGRFAYQGG